MNPTITRAAQQSPLARLFGHPHTGCWVAELNDADGAFQAFAELHDALDWVHSKSGATFVRYRVGE